MNSNKPMKVDPATRQSLGPWDGPFGFPLFNRLSHELDEMFNRFGLEPHSADSSSQSSWMPEMEMSTKDDQFVVKVDVPGMKKEDLTLEVADDYLVLQGERKHTSEEKKDGYFRTERTYGSFCRTVPLPEGAQSAHAVALMHDGVLEISMPLTATAEKPRTLAIGEPEPQTKSKAA